MQHYEKKYLRKLSGAAARTGKLIVKEGRYYRKKKDTEISKILDQSWTTEKQWKQDVRQNVVYIETGMYRINIVNIVVSKWNCNIGGLSGAAARTGK